MADKYRLIIPGFGRIYVCNINRKGKPNLTSVIKPNILSENFFKDNQITSTSLSRLDSTTCGYESLSALVLDGLNGESITNLKIRETYIACFLGSRLCKYSAVTNDIELLHYAQIAQTTKKEKGSFFQNEEVKCFIQEFLGRIQSPVQNPKFAEEIITRSRIDNTVPFPKYQIPDKVRRAINQLSYDSKDLEYGSDEKIQYNISIITSYLSTYSGFREIYRITRDIDKDERDSKKNQINNPDIKIDNQTIIQKPDKSLVMPLEWWIEEYIQHTGKTPRVIKKNNGPQKKL